MEKKQQVMKDNKKIRKEIVINERTREINSKHCRMESSDGTNMKLERIEFEGKRDKRARERSKT